MDMIKNENQLIGAMEQLYQDYLKLTYENEQDKKKQPKETERLNDLIIKLVTEKEKQYANKYNEILQIVPTNIEEKLEQFKKLRVLEADKKQMVLGFLSTSEKRLNKDTLERLKAVLDDDKLEQLNETVHIIEVYQNNYKEIASLTSELKEIENNLDAKKEEISEEDDRVKSLEIGINHKIKELINETGESIANEQNIITNYQEYKELYNGMIVKKNDKELQKMAIEVQPLYKKYASLNALVNLKNIANTMGQYNDYTEKLRAITSFLTALKGQDIEKSLKEVIQAQLEVLNKYKKANQDKLVLENLKNQKTRKLRELQALNSNEDVMRIVGEFTSTKETEVKEIPPKTYQRKIGIIKNPLTNAEYGRVVIDAEKSKVAKKIMDINNKNIDEVEDTNHKKR
ncbi:unknown [Clostridium sp. CAG:762]|nr:unknown [Clostridium sp. CAG:762]